MPTGSEGLGLYRQAVLLREGADSIRGRATVERRGQYIEGGIGGGGEQQGQKYQERDASRGSKKQGRGHEEGRAGDGDHGEVKPEALPREKAQQDNQAE
jgi:hypothetical protein